MRGIFSNDIKCPVGKHEYLIPQWEEKWLFLTPSFSVHTCMCVSFICKVMFFLNWHNIEGLIHVLLNPQRAERRRSYFREKERQSEGVRGRVSEWVSEWETQRQRSEKEWHKLAKEKDECETEVMQRYSAREMTGDVLFKVNVWQWGNGWGN